MNLPFIAIGTSYILLSLILGPSARANDLSEFVVWNVGQGLWTSEVTPTLCRHYDMGGEHAPWSEIQRICAHRDNRVSFSHWDWDHIGFIARSRAQLSSVCIEAPPAGPAPAHRRHLLDGLPDCPDQVGGAIDISSHPRPRFKHESSANEWSRVFLLHAPSSNENRFVLVPGDSVKNDEKIWALRLPSRRTWLLVLGHHGSRTSTSDLLLMHLPRIRMAIASCRFAKYGHPHAEVMARLKKRGIALLKTEDWGSLHFELASPSTNRPAAQSEVRHDI